ncbi:MAG: hypothetical protein R3B49_10830 [Phycisphaerales bacterium]
MLNTAIGEAGSSLEVTFEHGHIASGGARGRGAAHRQLGMRQPGDVAASAHAGAR